MYLALDTETTGLKLHKNDAPFAVSGFDENGTEFYWEWDVDIHTRKPKPPARVLKEIKEVITSYDRYVFHNSTFDLWALAKIGIRFSWKGRVEDTSCTSHVLFSNEKKALKYRAKVDLKLGDDDEHELKEAVVAARRFAKKHEWGSYDNENAVAQDYWMPRQIAEMESYDSGHDRHSWHGVCRRYAVLDAVRTMALFLKHKQWLLDQELYELYDRERNVIPVIYSMKRKGVSLLQENLILERSKYVKERDQYQRKCERAYAGININSGPQLQELLFEEWDLPVLKKTEKKNPSTEEEVLVKLEKREDTPKKAKRFITNLLEYKVRSTAVRYLDNYERFQEGWRLYPGYQQNGTQTVRLSCSDPNTQNVSKGKEDGETKRTDFKLRSVFGPDRGRIWYPMDYSQLQLRIFAHITAEQSMLDAFDAGYDFHSFVASKIFSCAPVEVTSLQRRVGKNVNFGFIFGARPAKIESTAGRPGLWDVVTKQFPNAHAFMESTKKFVKENGYVVTPKGYKLWLPYKYGRIAAHAGVNYIVQGCEGDIVKDAMVSCHKFLSNGMGRLHRVKHGNRGNPYITMQVHDELVFDFPVPAKEHAHDNVLSSLKLKMEQAGEALGMKTPVDVDLVTNNWADSLDTLLKEVKTHTNSCTCKTCKKLIDQFGYNKVDGTNQYTGLV